MKRYNLFMIIMLILFVIGFAAIFIIKLNMMNSDDSEDTKTESSTESVKVDRTEEITTAANTDDETINKVICFLKEYKFIDDLEYAKSYTKECLYIKKYGRKKIKMMLYEKGIASDLIEEIMAEFDFDEAEEDNLSELIEKKLGGNFDFKNVMKTKRYFASRGYDYNVIDKALKKITESFDEF